MVKTDGETEKLHEFLTTENITWRFNLPRVSWWGGQFERPIGITKQRLSILKMISNILFQDLTVWYLGALDETPEDEDWSDFKKRQRYIK